MAVKIYVRSKDIHQLKDKDNHPILDSNGNPTYIELPEQVTAHDKWRNCTALVVSQGIDCYKGPRFEHSGPWCRVGDWVVIPRNEGTQINYRGVPMQIIPDDRVLAIVSDPSYVTRD
jgi:co-chaperonin GroES (HSP10)